MLTSAFFSAEVMIKSYTYLTLTHIFAYVQ